MQFTALSGTQKLDAYCAAGAVVVPSCLIVLVHTSSFFQIRWHGPNMPAAVAETARLGPADIYTRKTEPRVFMDIAACVISIAPRLWDQSLPHSTTVCQLVDSVCGYLW